MTFDLGLGLYSLHETTGVSPAAVLDGFSDCRIAGTDSVSSVAFVRDGTRQTIACGIVAPHAGFIPNTQFARLIGCRLSWNATQRGFEPVVDAHGNSSVPNVMIAGDAVSVEDEAFAAERGAMAGWEGLRQLGRITLDERDRYGAARRHDKVRAPERPLPAPDDVVIVCRCEEVTAGEIRAAVHGGARRSDELKGFTRCGMGPCQGRMCGPVVAEMIAAETGASIADVGLFRVRVPLKPIAMREMARCGAH